VGGSLEELAICLPAKIADNCLIYQAFVEIYLLSRDDILIGCKYRMVKEKARWGRETRPL
jgi:hypothetical protein